MGSHAEVFYSGPKIQGMTMNEDPERALRGRGRPKHEPTTELRARVAELVRLAADVTTIAGKIGISEKTLRLHYSDELEIERPQMGFGFVDDPLGAAPAKDRRKGGRPPHKPTKNSRNRVEVLVASGMYAFQIAAVLDISEPTLREHYSHELLVGGARKRAEMLEAMFSSGLGGNASSMKAWLTISQEVNTDAPAAPAAPERDQPKLGKKEQEMADAQHPDTGSTLGALMARRHGMDGSGVKH